PAAGGRARSPPAAPPAGGATSARAGGGPPRPPRPKKSREGARRRPENPPPRLPRLWQNRNARVPGDTVAILFRFDKWELDDRGQTALLEVAKQLQDNPNLVVELEGYTDSVGSMPYNVQLSQRRSEAGPRLPREKGIEMNRIHSIGLGDIRPTADNTTAKGREQNRRVMVKFFAPAE